MKRFTAQIPPFADQLYVDNEKLNYQIIESAGAINKLGQLEDIEDKKGVEISTLAKALKDGFFYKSAEDNSIKYVVSYISNKSYGFVCIESEFMSYYEVYLGQMRKECQFYLNEYGKTWALTREELL